MRTGGSPVGVGAVPTVTTLTLSSPSKATLFRIILWRCWARSEHGIARLGTYVLQVRGNSASGVKFGRACGRGAIACPVPLRTERAFAPRARTTAAMTPEQGEGWPAGGLRARIKDYSTGSMSNERHIWVCVFGS